MDPPRGDALSVPLRMDVNIGDALVLLRSIAAVQVKITKDCTHRPGTVLVQVSVRIKRTRRHTVSVPVGCHWINPDRV